MFLYSLRNRYSEVSLNKNDSFLNLHKLAPNLPGCNHSKKSFFKFLQSLKFLEYLVGIPDDHQLPLDNIRIVSEILRHWGRLLLQCEVISFEHLHLKSAGSLNVSLLLFGSNHFGNKLFPSFNNPQSLLGGRFAAYIRCCFGRLRFHTELLQSLVADRGRVLRVVHSLRPHIS